MADPWFDFSTGSWNTAVPSPIKPLPPNYISGLRTYSIPTDPWKTASTYLSALGGPIINLPKIIPDINEYISTPYAVAKQDVTDVGGYFKSLFEGVEQTATTVSGDIRGTSEEIKWTSILPSIALLGIVGIIAYKVLK